MTGAEQGVKLLGIVGRSQSGKDTLSAMVVDIMGGPGSIISFAAPMKMLVSVVFQFDHDTLWGPSELRNKPDIRYGRVDDRPMSRLWNWWVRHHESVSANQKAASRRFFAEHRAWLDSLIPDWQEKYPNAQETLTDWFFESMHRRSIITPRYILQTLGDWGRALDPNLWADATIHRARYETSGPTPSPIVVISDVRYPNTEARAIRNAGGELWRIRRPGVDFLHVEKAGIKGHSSESQIDSLEMDALVTKNIPNDSTLDVLRERVRAAMKERGLT